MSIIPNGKISTAQILLPLSLVAFTLFLMLGFQTTQIVADRAALQKGLADQEKPLEETKKVQQQVTALAQGTMQLAQKGNKSAKAIIDRMKQAGLINEAAPAAAPGAAGPAPIAPPASAPAPAAPKKP